MNDAMALAGLMTGVIGGVSTKLQAPLHRGPSAPIRKQKKARYTGGRSEIVSKPWPLLYSNRPPPSIGSGTAPGCMTHGGVFGNPVAGGPVAGAVV